MAPAEGVKAADVEKLAGGAVGLVGVEGEAGLRVDGAANELSELAEAEQSALERKRDAEERLRSLTELDIGEHLAEASNGLAAIALAKAEEIDALKDRVDQRFAEGRTSVLRLAI